MKKLSLLLFGLLLVLSACKKDENDPDNSGTTTDPTTAQITFTVKYLSDSGNTVSGALVGISPNQDDLNNNTPLHSRTSDSFGKAKFTNLQPLDYYYKVSGVVNGQSYSRSGAVNGLEAGDHSRRTVILR